MYCDLKAARGWALYCNTMRSQDATRRWALGFGLAAGAQAHCTGAGGRAGGLALREGGRPGWAGGLCAPGRAVGLWAVHLVHSACF